MILNRYTLDMIAVSVSRLAFVNLSTEISIAQFLGTCQLSATNLFVPVENYSIDNSRLTMIGILLTDYSVIYDPPLKNRTRDIFAGGTPNNFLLK